MTNPFLQEGNEPDGTIFVYVQLPGAIWPEDREALYGQPLDAELRLAGIGYISGGGTMQGAPDEAGNCPILFCGVDVDTIDVDAARGLLRDHLPELGCPPGTTIQWEDFQDRFDGEHWHIAEQRSAEKE